MAKKKIINFSSHQYAHAGAPCELDSSYFSKSFGYYIEHIYISTFLVPQ